MAYLTQAEAAVYSSAFVAMDATLASALLQSASDLVDAYCGRTFDTVIDGLPSSVAIAVAYWAEEISGGLSAGRDAIEEKVGDYMIKYSQSPSSFAYGCPASVATLLAPYRIVVVG